MQEKLGLRRSGPTVKLLCLARGVELEQVHTVLSRKRYFGLCGEGKRADERDYM